MGDAGAYRCSNALRAIQQAPSSHGSVESRFMGIGHPNRAEQPDFADPQKTVAVDAEMRPIASKTPLSVRVRFYREKRDEILRLLGKRSD